MKKMMLMVLLSSVLVGCHGFIANNNEIINEFQKNRMLIWKASLSLEVDNINKATERIIEITKENKGYIEDKRLDDNSSFLSLRIPTQNLNSALENFSALGNILSKDISATDTTDKYIDVDSRLKNKVVLRDRLKKLLEKAFSITDVLAIEKELNRVQSDIDSMTALLKSIKNKVDFSTVNIEISNKRILGPLGYLCNGIGWFVEKLFIIRK